MSFFTTDAGDPPGEGAALFAIARLDELLVIHAVQPATEKPTGKGHLELVAIGRRRGEGAPGQRGIERLAINLANRQPSRRRPSTMT